jgi:hypothetical protein
VQELFWGLITAPEGVRPALDDLTRRGLLEGPGLDGLFVGDDRLSSVERLDIYANMYFFRLLDCVREDFPKVAAAIGGDRFHNLVTDYVLRHPSRHPSLRYLGQRFPAFIAAHPIAGERPWLADLARLEWARADLFDAPDAGALGREDLARLPEDRAGEARLRLVPAFALLRFDFGVVPLWRDLEDGAPEAAGAAPREGASLKPGAETGVSPREGNSAAPDVSSAPAAHAACVHAAPARGPRVLPRRRTWARVWRKDFIIYHRSVDADEARCLDLVRQGESLARICQQVAAGRSVARATTRVGRLMQGWIDDGILARYDLPGEGSPSSMETR